MAAYNDWWQRKVAPCLDGAAAVLRQSSLAVVELLDIEMTKTVITDGHNHLGRCWRLDFGMKSKPLHRLRRYDSVGGWTSK
ncbi:hypothetical protein HYC85_030063 [Camellia sinensis]|uniref:Uncharacterized protein n=1 Tax=Camellia sinensis TaxID=4442 RepID=A0A7J7FZP2_CAMSI|nr:hypothetical protein HYC85_030063 [Camellia sinensis]